MLPQNRRAFMSQLGTGFTVFGSYSLFPFSFNPILSGKEESSVNFGFITDLHHGLCKGTLPRLQSFIDEASSKNLDFIMQGGDFCFSEPAAQPCIDLWNTYNGDKYHVLGNHDMDKGSKADIMKLWGMERNYYSFDKGNFHFIVLDANFINRNEKYEDYDNANFYIPGEFRAHVNPEQLEWLEEDLRKTDKQTIIFSHQAFDEMWGGYTSPSRFKVRKIIDDANNNFDFQKVIACFCGHHHVDEHSVINNVHYFQMNSASYYWAGKDLGSDGPMAMYSNPLYAFITISTNGEIRIEGKQGEFMSPNPKSKGHPDAPRLSASISDKDTHFRIK